MKTTDQQPPAPEKAHTLEYGWSFDPLNPNGRVQITHGDVVFAEVQSIKTAKMLIDKLNTIPSLLDRERRLAAALKQLLADAEEADAALCGYLGSLSAREVKQSFPDFKQASDRLDKSTAVARAALAEKE